MILVGDIGGSNTSLALAKIHGGRVEIRHRRQYANADAHTLVDLIRQLLADQSLPERACLAVAGPTDGRRVRLTNLDWHIDADEIGRQLGFQTELINDFEAVAWGLDALSESDLVTLQAGNPAARATRVAMGPGTGLGVALSVATETGYRPLPGEGGHIGFAPADDEQAALLRHLQTLHGRVSVERILSGPGIADLFAFCRAASGRPVKREHSPTEISQTALDGSDPIAVRAMRLFCRILGQTAGDLALAAGARGGVYIAGGIPPRILPMLLTGEFIAGFRDKGRFSAWAGEIPVHVVTDPDIGLKGAALMYG